MRRPRQFLAPSATLLSFLLIAAAAAGWVTGLVRERHATVWRLRARPERTVFLRIDRHHLILSDHSMVPVSMPPEFALDTTRFAEFLVVGPGLPNGGGITVSPDGEIVSPAGAWFRKVRTPIGGVKFADERGSVAWQANGFYSSVEIPWWSLLVVFSLWPAERWAVRHRRRAKVGRGLCPECGYDLRATPDRCPECGTGTAVLAPS